MIQLLKKLFLIQLIIVTSMLYTNLQSIAQPQQATHPDVNTDREYVTETEGQQPEELITGAALLRVKHGLAFKILGRELTQRERDSYGDSLTEEGLKTILAREQRLVIVRALITVGETDIKYALDAYPTSSRLQTYDKLVRSFYELIEKYGSVKTGIKLEYVENIKDSGEALKRAASRAYETVFGIPEDKQDKEQILPFLAQNNATTYSKMVQVLIQTITPEVKKQILLNALDQSERPDLKTNDKFVKKMLEQTFTHKELMKLFIELKETAPPAQPAQGKNLHNK